jgi:hypothetical protein
VLWKVGRGSNSKLFFANVPDTFRRVNADIEHATVISILVAHNATVAECFVENQCDEDKEQAVHKFERSIDETRQASPVVIVYEALALQKFRQMQTAEPTTYCASSVPGQKILWAEKEPPMVEKQQQQFRAVGSCCFQSIEAEAECMLTLPTVSYGSSTNGVHRPGQRFIHS